MRPMIKLAAAGGVLAFGLAVALWFRKPVAATDEPPAKSAVKAPDSSQAASLAEAVAGPSQGVPLPGGDKSPAARTEPAAEVGAGSSTGEPPAIPPQPPAFYHDASPAPARRGAELGELTAGPTTAPRPSTDAQQRAAALPGDSLGDALPAKANSKVSAGWRSHTVVDGDTLSLLAARYLGDAGRYAEIWQANAGAVKVADLLPIGIVLRIPPAGGADPESSTNEPADLVPVPPGVLSRPR